MSSHRKHKTDYLKYCGLQNGTALCPCLSLLIQIYALTQADIDGHKLAHINTRAHTCILSDTHAQVYSHMCSCLCTWAYASAYLCNHACTHMQTSMHSHIYKHTHTNTHNTVSQMGTQALSFAAPSPSTDVLLSNPSYQEKLSFIDFFSFLLFLLFCSSPPSHFCDSFSQAINTGALGNQYVVHPCISPGQREKAIQRVTGLFCEN